MRTRQRGAKERRGRVVTPPTCAQRARGRRQPPAAAGQFRPRQARHRGVTGPLEVSRARSHSPGSVAHAGFRARPGGTTVTPLVPLETRQVRGDIRVPWHIASHCVSPFQGQYPGSGSSQRPLRLDTPVAGPSMTWAPLLQVAGRCQSPDRGESASGLLEAQLRSRRRSNPGNRGWYVPPRDAPLCARTSDSAAAPTGQPRAAVRALGSLSSFWRKLNREWPRSARPVPDRKCDRRVRGPERGGCAPLRSFPGPGPGPSAGGGHCRHLRADEGDVGWRATAVH